MFFFNVLVAYPILAKLASSTVVCSSVRLCPDLSDSSTASTNDEHVPGIVGRRVEKLILTERKMRKMLRGRGSRCISTTVAGRLCRQSQSLQTTLASKRYFCNYNDLLIILFSRMVSHAVYAANRKVKPEMREDE